MKQILKFATTLALSCSITSQTLASGSENEQPIAPRIPNAVTASQVHSGHSLTDSALKLGSGFPDKHYKDLLDTLSLGTPDVTITTIPGSGLGWRRVKVSAGAWDDMADYEIVSVTEVNNTYPVAVFGDLTTWVTQGMAEHREDMLLWLTRAGSVGNGGSGADFFFYTPWPDHGDYNEPAVSKLVTITDWRDRLTYDEVEHLSIATYAEDNLAGDAKVWIIPGNAMMMQIYDDAENGDVPNIADGAAFLASTDWWADSVHPQGLTSLALAYLHMYVIHHIDPRGQASTGFTITQEPTAAEATYIQNMVYDLVQSYPRAGVP